MPEEPSRDLDDLDHALFDAASGVPDPFPSIQAADLDAELFAPPTVPTLSHGAGVGYAPPRPPLSRTRRLLVGLGVVLLVALAVSATVAFASRGGDQPAKRVGVSRGAIVTSTSAASTTVALRTPLSLPVASVPAPTSTTANQTTTTARRSTTPSTEATPDVPPETQPTEPPPTQPPSTEPPTTAPPTTTTTTLPPTTTTLFPLP